MIKCKKCSAENVDGASFCNFCGERLTVTGEQSNNEQVSNNQGPNEKFDFAEEIKNVNFETQDNTAEFDPKDIEENKVISLFSYINLLFLIPLLAKPDSKYAKFHTNQGIVLFILSSAVSVLKTLIVTVILKTILLPLPYSISTLIFTLASTFFDLLSMGVGILAILGIINACSGKAKTLPLIGKFKILK